jgi:4-amino-4-deoxy-L-arabinose transferase-like glycosyltransferase
VLAVALALVSLHIVLAWTSRSPGVSWGEDDAEYIILGREILQGQYAERWDVDAPAHARLPPGFPALLSIGNGLFGDSVGVYTLIVLLCSAASIALFFLVVRRHFGDAVALFVTALTAINAMAVSDAGYVMAEAPFRFWATLTLWSASRENPRAQHLVLAGAAAVMAALTRSVGVTIIAALAVHWILERRWKAVALLVVGSMPVGAWFYWTLIAPDPNQRALYLHAVFAAAQTSAAESQQSPLVATLKRMVSAIVFYPKSLVPVTLSFFALKANPLDNLLWAALGIATVPLGLLAAWRRWRLLVLVLLFYAMILAVWPWRYERFISPISSMILVLIAVGVVHLLRRQSARVQHLALAGVASLFVIGSVQAGLPTLRAMLACDRSRPLESPTCFTEDRRGLLQLAAFARQNTPPDAVFFVPKEGAFYLHSDRRTVRDNQIVRVPADSLGSVLRRRGVSYAAVSPIGVNRRGHNRVIAQACREFEKVASFEGDAVLLRLRENGPIDHDDETCQLIAEWKTGGPARWTQ